ncbi:MAG: ABC transporter ATP-binding protein [Dehalococcoidia bacterium]
MEDTQNQQPQPQQEQSPLQPAPQRPQINFFVREYRTARRKIRGKIRVGSDYLNVLMGLSPYFKMQKLRLTWAMTVTFLITLVALLEPWPLKLILDHVILDLPVPGYLAPLMNPLIDHKMTLLYILIGALITITILGGICHYLLRVAIAMAALNMITAIRFDIFQHIQRLSFSFHDRRSVGDLIARMTSDVRLMRRAIIRIPMQILGDALIVIGVLIVLFFLDWQLTVIGLCVLPALALATRIYQAPMKAAVRRQRQQEGTLTNIMSETLQAIRVVQGFTGEDRTLRRFGNQNRRVARQGARVARLESKFNLAAQLILAIALSFIIFVAVRRILAGALTPGDLLVFIFYLQHFFRPFRRISRMGQTIARSTAAGERLIEAMNYPRFVEDQPDAVKVGRPAGEITFEGLTFAYYHFRRQAWHNPVLKDINLTIRPGERIAIVGPTGAGKSTLASLIPRFYDPIQGRVCVDGQDVRSLTLNSLRSHVSFVFQEPILFASSIKENIAYGKPDATEYEIQAAAQASGIHEIIMGLEQGYSTVVGERGGTLSGGQRMCISIARAMIKDAPIVIMDEPTLGLDVESNTLVTEALHNLTEGRTVVMISHNMKTVRDADRIIVLQNGRIVEDGNHHSLLASRGTYYELVGLWTGEVAV